MRLPQMKPLTGVFLSFALLVTMAMGCLPPTAQALPPISSGLLLYGEGTVTTPRTRSLTAFGGLSAGESSAAVTAATIRHVVVKAAPNRDELLAGIQTTGGILYILRFDGTSWTNAWNVTVGNRNIPSFDIAYEQSSGEALVVYSGNVATTNELRYRVWNGTAWTVATNLNPARTAGIVHSVKMASRPGANDIGLAWGDAALDLSAQYWNGATNVWVAEPAAALTTSLAVVGTSTAITTRSFDIAFESISGEMMVAWGANNVLDLSYAMRGAGAAGTWVATVTDTTFPREPTDFELSPDPDSDYIAYANASDAVLVLDAGIWTGTAWTAIQDIDTTVDTVATGTRNATVAWMTQNGQTRALVAYDDLNAVGLDWTYYNKNTNAWAAVPADFTTAPAAAGGNDVHHVLHTNPHNKGQALHFVVDSSSDLFVKKVVFDGTNFTWSSLEPGGVSPEVTISSVTGRSVEFAFYRNVAAGTVSTDIVNATGVPVASPTLTMSAVNALITCQTTTGTLGTSSAKIRVFNSPSTPGWTLTAAATAGTTATWNTAFDFNDGSSCTDGADADTKAGQLQFQPAAATVTPATGCSNTGLSNGATTGFNQGIVDNVTLVTASSAAMSDCYWDISNIGVTQQIPGEVPAGSYTLDITLTVTAS